MPTASRPGGRRLASCPAEVDEQGYFTAEHVFPWMWEDYGRLRPHRPAAELLAEHRVAEALRRRPSPSQRGPVAATIYVNDVYVERDFAMETAGLIRDLRPWITDEYEHNGLRADGERVLDRLLALVKGRA